MGHFRLIGAIDGMSALRLRAEIRADVQNRRSVPGGDIATAVAKVCEKFATLSTR